MSQSEVLEPTPPLFPLGRVAPLRALSELLARERTPVEAERISAAVIEEQELIFGSGKKKNPVGMYMNLMLFNLDDETVIPPVQFGMIAIHRATRYKADALSTTPPIITALQVLEYLKTIGCAIENGTLHFYGSPFEPIQLMEKFGDTEKHFMRISEERGVNPKSTHGTSFKLGASLMWDFLKTAPTLNPPPDTTLR